MKKDVTRRDFWREIKKSPGRFLSILFIVIMGTAFFSGIRTTGPSMRITGDTYFDNSKLMDIKAISIYGITEKDVAALQDVEGVQKVIGTYSADFIHETEQEQQVLHVMALTEDMNTVEVYEGRLPENVGECMADSRSAYQIGDIITLTSGTEDEVTDTFKTTELEVVGLGSSPCYISPGRGSATIGSGKVNAFLVVPEDTFDMEIYTEAYIQVEGAKHLNAFTDEYETAVDDVMEKVEVLSEERVQVRKQEIIDDALEELDEVKEEYREEKQKVEDELEEAKNEIEEAEEALEDAKQQVADGKRKIKSAKETLKEKKQTLSEAEDEYKEGQKELKKGKKTYNENYATYQTKKESADEELSSARESLDEITAQIEVYEEAREVLIASGGDDARIAQYTRLIVMCNELQKGISDAIEEGESELKAAETKLKKAKREIEANERKLEEAKDKIESGKEQMKEAEAEIEQKETEIVKAEKEISKNEKKLKEAKEEYEEGEKEAEKELKEAWEEIEEAEKDIYNIKEPKWYVYDRSTLTEYSSYGENAERIGAIGKVFPWIFFMVAALISLTSMTRMVEEQRLLIGTMKALGYKKGKIAAKYVGYAMLATVTGSVIGVLLGEKVIPYTIIYAYGMLYQPINDILLPYDWGYAAVAVFTAIACVLLATMSACNKALKAQPAVLMRPPAPKSGKRILLERVKPFWKLLNFTWKSTVRNLSRYKKRLFMTVFGISGCMGLLLVGFGLRDSIYQIAELQYKEIQVYDGSIYLEEDLTNKEMDNLYEYLDENKDVVKYTDANMKSVTLMNGKKERQAYECVFPSGEIAEEYVQLKDRISEERYTLNNEGVIISEKTAKLLGVGVGDEILIKDEEDGNKHVIVNNICENYMSHYIYFTEDYYREVYKVRPEYNSIFFSMNEEYEKEDLEAAGQKIMQREEVLSISYMHDIQKTLDDMLESLNLVIIVLIVSAGLLAFVVLYNLNTINITERQRELATLKVLGFYNSEVSAYVYRENIILTLLGALAGVGIGRALHQFIVQTIEVDNAMFGRVIKPESYIISVVMTFAFSMIVNGIMYFKLKKINMVESLKSVE